jgi:hypothetical protein
MLLALPFAASAWGYAAHRKINSYAVYTLPEKLQAFYRLNIDYVTAHAVDPDKRRYCREDEGARHFIDLDHYGAYPFEEIPLQWKDAVGKYGEDSLKAEGILPWQISFLYYDLVKAFREKDAAKILDISAELGHYVADAWVPLHTTINYDGELTQQWGIHALWESRVPESREAQYIPDTARALFIEDPLMYAWSIVKDSYQELDSVFYCEKALKDSFPKQLIYDFGSRGNKFQPMVYSDTFVRAYDATLKGMVERRMEGAIFSTGSLWKSAWVEAGEPDLEIISRILIPAVPGKDDTSGE